MPENVEPLKKNKTVADRIWKFFTSIKLAVVLIALIGLTSMIGTIVEQNAEPEKNLKLFAKIFGNSLAPTAYKVSSALGLQDMYHSSWFVALLVMFAINLIVCSFDRLPSIHRLVTEPLKPIEPGSISKFGINKEFILSGNQVDAMDTLKGMFRKLGFIPESLTEGTTSRDKSADKSFQLYAQKSGFSRYAVYVIHLSIIVVLAGSIIGVFFGFNGFLNLPEGETSDVAYTHRGQEHPLGFSVRCDDFNVQFYGTTDTPKDYVSWLSILEGGKKVLSKAIQVNHPLKYKGYTFYQASYGPVPDAKGIIVLRVTPRGGNPSIIYMKKGETFKVPGSAMEGTVALFSPALGFDKEDKPFTYTEMMNNPAVFIQFKENGKVKYGGWVAKRYPETWKIPDGTTVELITNWGYQYTGLQVRKDPGVLVVYAGCLFMTIGLYCAFFMSHRKIWAVGFVEKGKVTVKLAGTTNKHKIAFEADIDKAISAIQRRT